MNMLLRTSQVIAGRYEIVEKIGVGGMAIVYMAKDLKLDRYVTFKVLKEEHLADDFVFSKFNIEARAAASLSNQNIVSVYDVGVEKDIHYIVMEYIDGITLKELIKMRAPFENEETLGVAIQIAQALSHAHFNKVVHQDIKPQNILVTNDGIVKVTDFGIASAQVSASTTTATTVGSVHYFSPEQARGRYVDHRSDIYSLGIVMYEMSTGTLPFEGDSPVAIALKHINEPLPDNNLVNVSSNLKKIIIKATNKLSNQRYSSIEEMIEDLKLALTNEKVDEVTNSDISPTIKLNGHDRSKINENSQNLINPDSATEKVVSQYERPQKPTFDIFNPPEQKETPFKKIEKKIVYIAIATAGALGLILITVIFFVIFSGNQDENGQATVPNFLNLTYEQANTIINEYNIEADFVMEYNNIVTQGVVFSQHPEEGTPISNLTTLTLTVSQGAEVFVVPDFVGSNFATVQASLADNQIITITSSPVPSEYTIGTIITQSSPPGVSLPPGSVIALQVSSGPEQETIQMPALVGITEENAVAQLNQLGINFSISRVNNDTIPLGSVITQSVSPGTTTDQNTTVVITVSLGPVEDVTADEEPPQDEEEVPQEPAVQQAIVNFHLLPDFDTEIFTEVPLAAVVEGITIFESIVPVESFPIPIPIEGTGEVVVQFFMFGTLVSEEVIQFSD